MKKVEIFWYDAFSFDGWTGSDETKAKLGQKMYEMGALCTTVGYLLEETEGRVVVIQALQEDEIQMGNVWIIPRAMVKEIKELVYV